MKLYLKKQPGQTAAETVISNPGAANMGFPVIASPVSAQAPTPDSASDVLQPVKKLYLKKQPSQVKYKSGSVGRNVLTNDKSFGEAVRDRRVRRIYALADSAKYSWKRLHGL